MCSPNIMLPSIRLIVGAILATIVAVMTRTYLKIADCDRSAINVE